MGTMELFLCFLAGHFITAQSVITKERDAVFPQRFPGFFDRVRPFPFKRNFDFTPYDTIFSSRRTLMPDFHMLADLPPIMNVPKVEVFCDESKLTLLVDKMSNGVPLAAEEIQLGDGCFSNRDLPSQFVFTYGLDECGTTPVMQNGLARFTNMLHLNLKKSSVNWWQTPSTVHISCVPRRTYYNPDSFDSVAPAENGETFKIKAMNPSWTSTAESNIYKRGQVVNLQVSAQTRPEQQLFIQSCFVSASPEPQKTRPRHAVITNKGCTAPLGSSHAVIQFVASSRADVVNFVLNTSYLISELYVHCSVVITDQGVTFGSKSCNYNLIQSRWEDLSGAAEVCECCSSKCRGLSAKRLAQGTKAIVSTGPLVIVDKDVEKSPEPPVPEPQTFSAPVSNSMQSDSAAEAIVSGTPVSRSQLPSPPQDVVVVRQDSPARLTVWIPGQAEDADRGKNIGSKSEGGLAGQLQASDIVSNELPELQPPTTVQAALNTPTNKIRGQSVEEPGSGPQMWDLNLFALLDGWAVPPQLEMPAIPGESRRKRCLGRRGICGTEAQQEVDVPSPAEMTVIVRSDFNQMGDELARRRAAVEPQEGTDDGRPVIRSKLQFSKGPDGSQTLSYEEDVVKQQQGGVVRRPGMDGLKGEQEPRQKGLFPTFLDLLRRMDKAE